jgi:transcriptional regulator GlxA family with amidase domain
MSGFGIHVEHDLSVLEQAQTIVVPAWRDPGERPSDVLLDALRKAHVRGSRMVGLCLGAFVLAEAGLLDGRRACTHWVWADDFRRMHPDVKLDREVLYVDDGDVLTSAGTAAAVDCCLHLLRRDHGAEVAKRVARRLVVAPHRHGGQAQYIEQPVSKAEQADAVDLVLAWALQHQAQPHGIDSLAARALMSRRHFARLVRARTGTTVAKWLVHHRLIAAQRLLETTRTPIDGIAERVGFGSAVSLRQRFTAAFGVPPATYRKQFGPG